MDIEKNWQNFPPGEQLPEAWLRGGKWHKPSNVNPLQKLKRSLQINLGWALPIALLYIYVIVVSHHWVVQVSMVAMLLFTLWAIFSTWTLYRNVDPQLCVDCSLVGEMRRQHAMISRWMRNQERVALFFYPIGAAGGFIMGGLTSSGKSLSEFMGIPMVQVAFVLAIVLLTPGGWYLARWMNKKAFGQHLQTLQERIDALNTEA